MASNPDFKDLFSEFSVVGAEFLVVGAHAVMFHTQPRYTKDLDVWTAPTQENASRVYRALAQFGAPMADLTVGDLATPGTLFQIGIAPNRIDIMTSVDALDFQQAWARSVESTYEGIPIRLLSAEDLVRNKRAVGRPQDLLDIERLLAAGRRE